MTYWDRLFNSINNPIIWVIIIAIIVFGGAIFLLGDPDGKLEKVEPENECTNPMESDRGRGES